jgi:hypothetical protein
MEEVLGEPDKAAPAPLKKRVLITAKRETLNILEVKDICRGLAGAKALRF